VSDDEANERFSVDRRAPFFELARTRTDANGEFAFAALPEDELELELRPGERAAPLHEEPIARGARHVDLVVPAATGSGVVLAGRVHARGGGAVQAFVLGACPERTDDRVGARASRASVRGAGGDASFRVALGASGDWLVVVSAPGFAPWTKRLAGLEPGVHALDVELAPERTLLVRVVDRRGAPVPYATIAIEDADGTPLSVAVRSHERRSALVAGPGGDARLEGLPASLVRLAVTTPLSSEAQEFELDLAAGDVVDETLTLAAHDVALARRAVALALVAVEGDDSALRFGPPHEGDPEWNGHLRVAAYDAAGARVLSFQGTLDGDRLRADPVRRALWTVSGADGEIENAWLQELRPNWGAAFGRDFFPATFPLDALPIPAAATVLTVELDHAETLRLEIPAGAGDGAQPIDVTAEVALRER
jgi:hypothetical protein